MLRNLKSIILPHHNWQHDHPHNQQYPKATTTTLTTTIYNTCHYQQQTTKAPYYTKWPNWTQSNSKRDSNWNQPTRIY